VQHGYEDLVPSPWFVADFDSSTALLRALAASLRGRRFGRLGRGRLAGRLVEATTVLPAALRAQAFTIAGAAEAIPARRLREVSADAFARWVVGCYPDARVPAVAIGSSDGAMMHLFAAAGIPWLPQTFLVPVARRADPDDVDADVELGRRTAPPLLEAEPTLQLHQMHDANEDRLMVRRMAYFRMKMLRLPAAYERFVTEVLPVGGTLVIVDDGLHWPAKQLGERHFFQAGALGGLEPEDYVAGSARVADFLVEQGSDLRRWRFPTPDCEMPEAEWGYAPELTEDLLTIAERHAYHVVRVPLNRPGDASASVANVLDHAHASRRTKPRRLLAETFICVEPQWALATGTVPFWMPFPVERSAQALSDFLDAQPNWEQIAVTLFAHGVSSAGLTPAARWQQLADRGRLQGTLVGVDAARWPLDFAALARYSDALDEFAPEPIEGRTDLPRVCDLDTALCRLPGAERLA